MAIFYVEGRRYTASLELIAPTIPRQSIGDLVSNLESFVEILKGFETGVVKPQSLEDWKEVLAITGLFTQEVEWRNFFRSVGITMEVR